MSCEQSSQELPLFGGRRRAPDIEQLELPDLSRRRRGENIQTDPGRSDRSETVDSFVPDCVSLYNRLPMGTIPRFDAKMFDVLSVIQPFHCQCMIKSYRSRE